MPNKIINDLLKVFSKVLKMQKSSQVEKSLVVPILIPNKDNSQPESYRPITLLLCTGKVMEKIVQRRLKWFVKSNHILSKSQCRLRRGLNTMMFFCDWKILLDLSW